MLLFLRGSNAGHGATRRAGLFSSREHTALLCFPLWDRSLLMTVLRQDDPGPLPLPQVPPGQVPLK